jgi:hypothetical protein
MGTISKKFYVPTDAKVTIRNTFYYDLEDADCENAYDKAREIVVEDESGMPSDVTKAKLQERGLDDTLVEYAQEDKNDTHVTDFDEVNVEVEWNVRWVDVCEWCSSANCDGDPDECSDAPTPCDYCRKREDDCTCTFCEFCDEYIAEGEACECSNAVSEREKVQVHDKPMIFVHDLPVNDDEPDVESLL